MRIGRVGGVILLQDCVSLELVLEENHDASEMRITECEVEVRL